MGSFSLDDELFRSNFAMIETISLTLY